MQPAYKQASKQTNKQTNARIPQRSHVVCGQHMGGKNGMCVVHIQIGGVYQSIHYFTRWWQLKYVLFSPRTLGKMNPFWRAYFFNWCSCFTTSLYWTIRQVADCPGSMPLTEEVQQCSLVSWYWRRLWVGALHVYVEPKIVGFSPPNGSNFLLEFPLFSPSIFGYPYFWKHPCIQPQHYINSQRLDRKMENCWSCWVRMPIIDLHKLLCLKKGLVIHIQAKGTPSWSRIEDGGLSTPGYY